MPKSILVVDDETVVAGISKKKLEEHGYEVQTAGDGHEALESLRAKVPDLIVLDIQMPKMNGYSFVVEKDKSPEYVNIPVIAITAYQEMKPLFERHHIQAYLLKPLKLQDLLDKVTELIGQP